MPLSLIYKEDNTLAGHRRKPIQYQILGNCWKPVAAYTDAMGRAYVHRNGKQQFTHRYIYQNDKGLIPDGMVIRHNCDNTWCLNVEHMSIGTQHENIHDMISRGRHMHGASHTNTKLSDKDVADILRDTGMQKDLAKKYDVSKATISRIKSRKLWTHVEVDSL